MHTTQLAILGGGPGGYAAAFMAADLGLQVTGLYMSGEARPLGFIVITKSGAEFVSVGKVPRK